MPESRFVRRCDLCGQADCDGECREPCPECGCDHCYGGCVRDDDDADDCLNCGVCQDCIDRSIAAAAPPPDARDRFVAHLERASEIVRTWPAWKRNVFGPHLDSEP